jgi:hypothetical protein
MSTRIGTLVAALGGHVIKPEIRESSRIDEDTGAAVWERDSKGRVTLKQKGNVACIVDKLSKEVVGEMADFKSKRGLIWHIAWNVDYGGWSRCSGYDALTPNANTFQAYPEEGWNARWGRGEIPAKLRDDLSELRALGVKAAADWASL